MILYDYTGYKRSRKVIFFTINFLFLLVLTLLLKFSDTIETIDDRVVYVLGGLSLVGLFLLTFWVKRKIRKGDYISYSPGEAIDKWFKGEIKWWK